MRDPVGELLDPGATFDSSKNDSARAGRRFRVVPRFSSRSICSRREPQPPEHPPVRARASNARVERLQARAQLRNRRRFDFAPVCAKSAACANTFTSSRAQKRCSVSEVEKRSTSS